MSIVLTVFEIAGSLGLFLYGMKILSDGLQKSAGGRMKSILQMMTQNRVMALLTGLLITVIIQSSSATTVMVVSFVNANLMTLPQAIGVIFGANIGTTVTGWIVAVLGFKMDITVLALCSIAVALPMMFSSKVKLKEVSEIFLGFGILFFGLEFLQDSMPDISGNTEVLSFLSAFEDGSFSSIIICVVIGTIMTMIVQSSSATMAITITMAYQGWIGPYTACALCLGQNIGTTVTAYLASIGANANARRASWAHILFNVIGSVLAIIFFHPLMNLVNAITPGDIHTFTGEALRESLPTFLAMFHTIFNVINALVFLPFTNQFARLVERLVKDKTAPEDEGEYHFAYLSQRIVETPEVYLVATSGETGKMADLARDMFDRYAEVFARDNIDVADFVKKQKRAEERADQMQEQLTRVCVKLQQESPSPTNAARTSSLMRIIDELESITDSVYNLTKLTEQRISEKISYGEEEEMEVRSLVEMVSQFLSFISEKVGEGATDRDREWAEVLERSINQQHKTLVERVHDRMGGEGVDVALNLHMLEVERNLEHIGDYCINIAQSLPARKEREEAAATS